MRHKTKHDGKKHKKMRVARFITNHFFYYGVTPMVENPIDHPPFKMTRNKAQAKEQMKATTTSPLPPPEVSKQAEQKEIYNNQKSENNDDDSNKPLEFETVSMPFPQCVYECIPSDFNIIKRGPLPSIIFKNDNVVVL